MAKDETPKPTAPDLVRFLCESSITAPAQEYSRQFGPGAIADLSEEIWPGRYLVDEVRPGTFQRLDADDAVEPALEIEHQDHDDDDDEE